MSIYDLFIIDLSIDRHLGHFHIFAIVYNAAISRECRCIFDTLFLLLLDQEVRLLEHMVLLFLTF